MSHVLHTQVKGQEEQVTDGQLIMFGDVECTLSAPVRHAGLFCGNLGLFCGNLGIDYLWINPYHHVRRFRMHRVRVIYACMPLLRQSMALLR